jgi:hypothetical protein
MKHTGQIPRNPREFVATIPPALEQVVLHTLEKRPQDRPGNAAEFRAELLSIADRLGLEHAAVTSGPNLAALRSVGTESPSGRLVIDISRLRENQSRSANSDVNELTVVSPANARRPGVDGAGAIAAQPVDRRPFPKVSVPLIGYKSKKQLIVIAAIVVAMLLTGVGLVVRSKNAQPAANAITDPSPGPTVEPSPSPSPSPSPVASPKQARKPPPKKKQEGNSFVRKGKSLLKKINPF